MTKHITITLTAVSLMFLSVFAANAAEAQTGPLMLQVQSSNVCSIASARRTYRLAKNDLERAADDTDFVGERIARNALRSADTTLRTPTSATCEARSRRYTDATRILERATRQLELREQPAPEPQPLRPKLVAFFSFR